jgi:hypothetical protein
MDLTMIIMSCEKYSDLWHPCSNLLGKFWDNTEIQRILVTDRNTSTFETVDEIFEAGTDLNWMGRLNKVLLKIKTNYVFLVCEDYFLVSSVNDLDFKSHLELMDKHSLVNLRLIPNPRPTGALVTEECRFYSGSQQYRIATQAGVWRTDFLKTLTEKDGSIWAFEKHNSDRVDIASARVAGYTTHRFPFIDAVHKGMWEPLAIRFCEVNDVTVDTARRELTDTDQAKKFLKGALLERAPFLGRFGAK